MSLVDHEPATANEGRTSSANGMGPQNDAPHLYRMNPAFDIPTNASFTLRRLGWRPHRRTSRYGRDNNIQRVARTPKPTQPDITMMAGPSAPRPPNGGQIRDHD